MRRKKGSFRNGRKQGARSNLHNFRSSNSGIKWNDQIAIEVAEKVEAKVEKVEASEELPPQLRKPKAKAKAKAKKGK